MPRNRPIFYSALLLTLVHLLLRFAGTGFQVYLSRRIGAAGIGLLQLTMSVGGLAMVAGMAGVRTAAMYLCAEELGKHRDGSIPWVLSGCFRYSILFSSAVAAALFFAAPRLSVHALGDGRTLAALRLYAAFLPVSCLAGVMTGYFTAANRIGTLAAVEVAEQALSMVLTMGLLRFWAGMDAGRACCAVILGSGIGGCLTFLSLMALRLLSHPPRGRPVIVTRRLLAAALPLGAADVLRSGISAGENLMVPRRLALYPSPTAPLAAFGLVTGMVFPVMMFPACILFGLAELLIPELARCAAGESRGRIRYLTRRGLWAASVYGCFFGGLLFLLAEPLCLLLYRSTEAARQLRLYACLVPMLYCDALTDAMIKGLGQQRVCVRYNILTSAMDVGLLFALLPKWGMDGYFVSFTVTHALNFFLSLRRLLRITAQPIPWHKPMWMISVLLLCTVVSSRLPGSALRVAAYLGTLVPGWYLARVWNRETLRWLRGLLHL